MKRLLTDKAVKAAKPNTNDKLKSTETAGGLYLLAKWLAAVKRDPDNKEVVVSRYWRYKYKFDERRKYSLLECILKSAWQMLEVYTMRRGGCLQRVSTPMEHKKHLQSLRRQLEQDSFEAVAREWFIGHKVNWTENHTNRVIVRLENEMCR